MIDHDLPHRLFHVCHVQIANRDLAKIYLISCQGKSESLYIAWLGLELSAFDGYIAK